MQSNGSKRVVTSCIPCYTRKKKVLWLWIFNQIDRYLTNLSSVTVAILAIIALGVDDLRSARTTHRRHRKLLLPRPARRTVKMKT
jgi:hypothetical protein